MNTTYRTTLWSIIPCRRTRLKDQDPGKSTMETRNCLSLVQAWTLTTIYMRKHASADNGELMWSVATPSQGRPSLRQRSSNSVETAMVLSPDGLMKHFAVR